MRSGSCGVLVVLSGFLVAGCLSATSRLESSPGPHPVARSTEGCHPGRPDVLPSVPAALASAPPSTGGLLAASPAPPPWAPLPSSAPRSALLPSGFFSPMPGGLLAGYRADTGLDIAGFRLPVHAIAAGTLDYAEAGHTRWTSRNDSPFTVRLRLDHPIPWGTHRITHAYYGHLSALDVQQAEGQTPPGHVEGGQRLGLSGWANGSPHLHLGLLLDDQVAQERWEFILDEGEVRAALQVGPNGRRLPRAP